MQRRERSIVSCLRRPAYSVEGFSIQTSNSGPSCLDRLAQSTDYFIDRYPVCHSMEVSPSEIPTQRPEGSGKGGRDRWSSVGWWECRMSKLSAPLVVRSGSGAPLDPDALGASAPQFAQTLSRTQVLFLMREGVSEAIPPIGVLAPRPRNSIRRGRSHARCVPSIAIQLVMLESREQKVKS